MFKTLQWEDWLGIVLGAWLVASPWVLGYSGESALTLNALLLGIVLAGTELLNLGMHETAEEWIDIVAGLWLVVSPAVLGFASKAAAVNAVAVGLLTVLFAAWALSPMDDKIRLWWHERASRH